ncbi:MAG: hypothetical protein A2744_00165 [Candidatus Buchananbacteria bacterium RIFCSPHIGHO2_01_FULL_44_11]|uniref:Uncharacterized protein n=1 Tax=Candidatus Buchananbacteria bacterium RIFCSPHIGHO2_01_FULL_44_11 TaxID=1797535 RepID=A0A1G1Y269_9BACT|nr:MAG: hypothetical protein A2744_00165 [Candidatus Buchananbacteria bacterium RIFCSPHIGHO2_01_FULL_44_11]
MAEAGERAWKEMTPAATQFEAAVKEINRAHGTILGANAQELAGLKELAQAYVTAADQFSSEEDRAKDDLYLQAQLVLETAEPAEL